MNSTKIMVGVGAVIAGLAVIPQMASAYRGDPTVMGPNYTQERHQAIISAFDNQDFAAWQTQMEGKGVARKVNQENFTRFTEAHSLMLEGKTQEAEQIRTELGLGVHDGTGHGQGLMRGQNQK